MAVEPNLYTTMADLIADWPDARGVLARHGMACLGCAMAPFETIAEAAVAYDLEPGKFLDELLVAGRRMRRRPRR